MQLQFRRRGRSLLAALAWLPVVAIAAGKPATLDTIVVTATRTAQTQDATLAPVTVITRADIERLQPASLPDLLNATPGAILGNSGGPGKLSSLFLRGTSGSQVLVLVDGFRIGAAGSGTSALQNIPLDQIERVEIVRGPFSSLYGSDAMGGVVQIFLRHDAGSFTPNARVGYGSYAHSSAAAGLAAAGTRGWLAVQSAYETTDGINACRVGAASAFAACFADQPDRDGFRDASLSVHGAYTLNQRWSADGLALRSQGYNEYDGSFSNANDYSNQVLGGQLHWQPVTAARISLRAGSSTDFNTNYLGVLDVGHFNTRRNMGSVQGDFTLAGNLLTLGYDWQRELLASSTAYSLDTRYNRALFAQAQREFGAQSLQVNARREDNSQYGGQGTGSLLWGWNFASHLRLTASAGTAFRAPTFNDLYYPGYANPSLRPEHSRNVELGLRGTPGWGQWSLAVYRNDIRDLISYDANLGLPGNIDRARITGVEGVAAGQWQGWQLHATATVLRGRDNAPGSYHYGHELPRRPARSARFDADRQFGALSVGAGWELNGRRYDDIGNQHPLGGYGLLNLRAGWRFNDAWTARLALNNALDKNYETIWYYNQPGRNAMLSVSWRSGSAH